MTRRKVVKRKGEQPPRTNESHGENVRLPLDQGTGDGEDTLKLLWRDLMSDVGGLILNRIVCNFGRLRELTKTLTATGRTPGQGKSARRAGPMMERPCGALTLAAHRR